MNKYPIEDKGFSSHLSLLRYGKMAGIETREVLESWKEISDYLKRTVKTCQRWEQELDLPIRRLDGTPRARVFAYKDELDYWLEDKLNSQEISTTKYLRVAKQKPKRLWIAIAIALGLTIIVVVTIRFIPGLDFLSPPPAKSHLAVLPIQNNTGDESLAYLQDALTNLIVSDLYQSKYIRVLTAERMNQILKDINKLDTDSYTTEDLKRIASMDGVTHFLSGAVTKFGDKIRLNISLQKAGSWKMIWADQQDGTENDMFNMVDALTQTLKPQLNLAEEQISDDFDYDVAKVVTTPNDQAYKFYLQAHKAMNDTEWNLAIENFERATTLDPDFAMAYRFLSGVYNHLALETGDQSNWDKLREAGQKSLDAIERRSVPERERLIIEGAYLDPDKVSLIPAKEMEIFKKLLELYPDDDYGNYRLAVRYYQGEAYDRTEKHLKWIVDFTNTAFTFYVLANVYLHQGRYTEAEALLERGLKRFPTNFYIYQRLAKLHAMQQDFDEALYWCDKGFEVEPIQFRDSLVRGDVLLFMGDFAAAEEEYRRCLDSKNNKARIDAAISLMYLYKTQGRYEDARMQAETAMQILKKNRRWDFDPFNAELSRLSAREGNIQEASRTWNDVRDRTTCFKLRGEIYVQSQQRANVEEVFNQIDDEIRKENNTEWAFYLDQNGLERPLIKRFRRTLYCLKARLALESGDYENAISYVEQAKEIYSGENLIPADLIEILGRVYYESGDLESAREQYEWISRMTYNRKEYGDIYAESFYMLGKIYEELGKKRQARTNYEHFLDLWKNADPGSPEVDDARARLATLQ
jgi:tetratricopeptide (TPR) repeat protein